VGSKKFISALLVIDYLNFKNANPQTYTKTFGQFVAKLNTEKGCKTRTTRTPRHNSTYTVVKCSPIFAQHTFHSISYRVFLTFCYLYIK
jgi:hypothetical protein